MTHDSIGLGEDGPTHQPVEHLAALRAIPNLNVFRPADAIEVVECWESALKDQKTPAYLEPDGSDFFSPSLEIADLMRRILPQKEFVKWFNHFYEKRSIANISEIPIISDINDFQTVHLVGLSFTRAWTMKGISKSLPNNHPLKKQFATTSDKFLTNALPLLFQGNYGGDHWLASFAVYALSEE